jgi:hypothetical protein
MATNDNQLKPLKAICDVTELHSHPLTTTLDEQLLKHVNEQKSNN